MWITSLSAIKKQQKDPQQLTQMIEKRCCIGNDNVFQMLEFICSNYKSI